MALLDILTSAVSTAADMAASKKGQERMEKGFQEDKVSREDYINYQRFLAKYQAKKDNQ